MKKVLVGILLLLATVTMISCTDADVASANLSKDADQFKIYRRVVFYNGITDKYILSIEGYCSIHIDTTDNQLELTVKTDDGKFLKHYLGLSDNVTYFAEQIENADVSTGRYKVIFKPSVIIPNIEEK